MKKKFAATTLYCRFCNLYCTVSVRISKEDSSEKRLKEGALGFTPRCCPFCGSRISDSAVDILAPERHDWKKKDLVS